MIPRRFYNLKPYIASFIHKQSPRPPFNEMLRWLIQPGKEKRASVYIEDVSNESPYKKVKFKGFKDNFYYPEEAKWVDFCQTVDEVFNPLNWHHFITNTTCINENDIVVDCGAAEGLFSFHQATKAKQIYAIEPVPSWHEGCEKTFSQFENVELMKFGVGHRDSTMRMSDDEIYSKMDSKGSLEIQVKKLDSLFYERGIPVSFIKADIEGYEFPMLLGAEELIRANKPKIAITVYHDINHYKEIEEFLKNVRPDYNIWVKGLSENGNPALLHAY